MTRSQDFNPRSRFGPVSIGVMVLAHGLIGYGLVSGLGGHALELIKKPMEATLITEVKLPPPPPAAPPAPPAPPVPPKATTTDIAVACPKQVAPQMPRKALDEGVNGVVTAEARTRAAM